MEIHNYYHYVTLVVFLVVFLGRTFAFHLTGRRVFTLGVGKKGVPALMELAFLPAFILWIVVSVYSSVQTKPRFLPNALWLTFWDSSILRIVGMIGIGLGLALFVWALKSFSSSWRVGIDDKTPGELVTSGVFGLTRNPIFIAIDLFLVGTFLIYSNGLFLVFSLGTVLGIHYQILQEEKHLLKSYPMDYQQYMKNVRRYI